MCKTILFDRHKHAFFCVNMAGKMGCNDGASCASVTDALIVKGIETARQSASILYATAPDIHEDAKAVFGVSYLSTM
jgi:hypothetical protein